MGVDNYRNGFKLTMHPHVLKKPLEWKTPQLIFVNSMSDLFHWEVPVSFIQQVFQTMRDAHWHKFQILTKRAKRLPKIDAQLQWAPNIWMGVSVENDKVTQRIDYLRQSSAMVKFLSLEPLLGPLPNLDLSGIDWVIVGGESGPGARPMEESWVLEIRDQCEAAGVKFFFKQWGGTNKKKAGRILDGRTYDAMPATPGEEAA